eukprot:CAMPEP_0172421296 /NCGR_PEP_ID=MMETSP1064-20121228/7548_1 /TAXON_ID=202472 /ORGANISM="Aulacoseira subarctica , Strain CCAP 1002/5" /LENGTH=433 /DNA_ID=CAMNT_0013161619 /DNA_START=92 /DNA_END=1393 /DNA_ORIENTATION=+
MRIEIAFFLLFAIATCQTTVVVTGNDVSAETTDTAKAPIARKLLRERIPGGKSGDKIAGSYIVQLEDDADVDAVALNAVERMHSMKQEMIASSALSSSSLTNTAPVKASHIYKHSIKGFLMENVPDKLAPSLSEIPGVKHVVQDQIITLDYETEIISENKDADALGGKGKRALQTAAQKTPPGITMVGGPFSSFNTSIKVFVIDTGCSDQTGDLNIDTTLSKNYAGGNNKPAWYDGNGHGTHVSGTIAAKDNTIGVIGVVPGATIVAVRVLDNKGSGSTSSVINGINYVAQVGKPGDVANMSLGGGFYQLLNNAVINAAAKGIRFAIAAGNDYGANAANYSPASANGPNISTVACCSTATDASGSQICSFSNVGAPPIDYIAPGLNILSLARTYGGTATMSGTSMSTPHVAGLYVACLSSSGTVNGYPFAHTC